MGDKGKDSAALTLKPIWMERILAEPALRADLFEWLGQQAEVRKESVFYAVRTGDIGKAQYELGQHDGVLLLLETILRLEREDRDVLEQERKGGQ